MAGVEVGGVGLGGVGVLEVGSLADMYDAVWCGVVVGM